MFQALYDIFVRMYSWLLPTWDRITNISNKTVGKGGRSVEMIVVGVIVGCIILYICTRGDSNSVPGATPRERGTLDVLAGYNQVCKNCRNYDEAFQKCSLTGNDIKNMHTNTCSFFKKR